MDHVVTVRYLGGAERTLRVAPGQTLLDAAEAGGVPIVSECESGVCGTCVAACARGRCDMGRAEGLSEVEREAGKILTCQATVQSDCVIELGYPLDDNAARLVTGEGTVTAVEIVSPTTALLHVDASALGETVQFQPGQFAQLKAPGADVWRSYSYANLPNPGNRMEFIVRLLDQGVMSDYLRQRAKPGDRIALRCSKGSFYLRPVARPLILVAGGTGLSAILSIAQRLRHAPPSQPIALLYGVTRYDDLCKRDALEALQAALPSLSVHTIVAQADPRWSGRVGVVTDLLDDAMFRDGEADVYLCGPAAMVDATRDWLGKAGLHKASVYYEKFVPSGMGTRKAPPPRVDVKSMDLAAIRREGRGTAVVVGGSIAGIATAKALTDRFDQVIVLEKDHQHLRMEGRPGAAQGWHLHHLLTAGRHELEKLFPGIIDDMVREGAFNVDMASQYHLRLAGSWKKRVAGDIQITCAGRPLLEWCVRRRLDDEPKVKYHYDAEMQDLVYDAATNTVLGVAIGDGSGGLRVIPAELVVDASGKSTRMPEFLERIGTGRPELEQDILNCFYSSMWFHVPPERQWTDKVMEICFSYRPNEQTYAAQYYIDSSRTILCSSLIEYNCYSPPRNEREFREFAKRMQSPLVAQNIEGLEPASQVHNFRMPQMQRYRYEKLSRLPNAMVVVGDAYTSTDPVAGLGMTITLQEVARLRELLGRHASDSPALVRRYFRAISKIADGAWFVIREQTLRFDWIKDVEKKRPFYFRFLNWYMDRVTELVHDDIESYKKFLAVIHLVKPASALLTPAVMARAIGKWAWTKLRGQKTLIERNYPVPAHEPAGIPLARRA
jgi:NAD(P)H-flavin reductase/2-polyprenyl-6-methoxyphenol hydroxylase-like FAD-dependent oxidoreductase/ferredoxin